jgi:hypothetical protein
MTTLESLPTFQNLMLLSLKSVPEKQQYGPSKSVQYDPDLLYLLLDLHAVNLPWKSCPNQQVFSPSQARLSISLALSKSHEE